MVPVRHIGGSSLSHELQRNIAGRLKRTSEEEAQAQASASSTQTTNKYGAN
jgi:hypothetical protein